MNYLGIRMISDEQIRAYIKESSKYTVEEQECLLYMNAYSRKNDPWIGQQLALKFSKEFRDNLTKKRDALIAERNDSIGNH